MELGHPLKEATGVALTAARLCVAEHMARRVSTGRGIAVEMTAFVAADVLDGVVLRSVDMDSPLRRIADGVVDHISVARVCSKIVETNRAALPYVAVLAARAAVVGAANALHLSQTGEVTKGRNKQKATNIATALFGVAAATGNRPATHATGGIAAVIAASTAPVHLRNIGVRHATPYREL